MDLRGEFTKGFLAGLIGGVATTIVGLLFYFLKIILCFLPIFQPSSFMGTDRKDYWKYYLPYLFIGALRRREELPLFSYLKAISPKNIFLKGWFFGVGIWFFAYVVTTLFKIPGLVEISLKNAFTNLLISSVYGLSLAWAYAYIEQNIEKAEV